MANTRTVGTGKDHATISLAVSWMASNHTLGTDGIGTISVEENAEFNENVDVTGIGGTASITSYIHIKAAAANKHSGAAGTGHARVRGSSSGSHVFTVQEDFTYISELEIQLDSTGSSDEGVRVTSGVDDVLISRCIIWTDQSQASQDGIYVGNWNCSYSIDNCIIYGFNRCGIDVQGYSNNGTVRSVDVDYCTIIDCGDSGSTGGAAYGGIGSYAEGVTNNIDVYNTACISNTATGADDYDEFHSVTAGTHNWAGTHNADSDGSLTTIGLTTNAQQNLTLSDTTQSSGSFFVVNETAGGSEDFLLLDDAAGNLAYGNGTDRVGSEPDTRQDFSTDIAGNSRSTTSPSPDIGASEYPTVGGGLSMAVAAYHYNHSLRQ